MKIVRNPLRTDIYAHILDRLLRGEYATGMRLKDTALAAELGVSRTPVREALIRLSQEGYLQATMGKGFTLRPMTVPELEELYPILWTLEALALRQSSRLPAEAFAELDRLAGALENPALTPDERIAGDEAWHGLLLSGCANATLHGLIADLKTKLRRYEYAYGGRYLAASAEAHRRIARLLRQSGPDEAAAALEQHWRFGMGNLLDPLRAPV